MAHAIWSAPNARVVELVPRSKLSSIALPCVAAVFGFRLARLPLEHDVDDVAYDALLGAIDKASPVSVGWYDGG